VPAIHLLVHELGFANELIQGPVLGEVVEEHPETDTLHLEAIGDSLDGLSDRTPQVVVRSRTSSMKAASLSGK